MRAILHPNTGRVSDVKCVRQYIYICKKYLEADGEECRSRKSKWRDTEIKR